MEKYISIEMAIKYLPDELITNEIARAAIEEGNISILNYLPVQYLTPDVVNNIVERGYGYGSFNLSNIPEEARNVAVCQYAVKKDVENIQHVPTNKINKKMLQYLLILTTKNIGLLGLIPDVLWDNFHVYKGLYSIFGTTRTSSYSRSSKTYTSPISDAEKYDFSRKFLSVVPDELKTKEFYFGLFDVMRIYAEDVIQLVPEEFKQYEFWKLMAKHNFGLVPEDKYSYEIFLIALGKNATFNHKLLNNKEIRKKLYACLDDRLADAIIENSSYNFHELPADYRTLPRLLKALELVEEQKSYCYIVDNQDVHLLTDEVCKIYIRKGLKLPEIPAEIWTEDFAEYCFQNSATFEWFRKMPKEFQTKEIIEQAIEVSDYNIKYARPELISLKDAKGVYRRSIGSYDPLEEYIPDAYINDFINQTGLPAKFFGGEVELLSLKYNKENYTYCKIGHCHVGIYKHHSQTYMIMTRRTPHSVNPQQVFDKAVGTFHNTWFEKMIADNDLYFIKPSIDKKLKILQINAYYDLEYVEHYKGFKIYSNVFLGERINYIVEAKRKLLYKKTLYELKQDMEKE